MPSMHSRRFIPVRDVLYSASKSFINKIGQDIQSWMKNTVVHSHYRKLFFMSESILGSTNFSISNELSKLCTLTKVENIGIPFSTSPLSVTVDPSISYIVIELGALIATNGNIYATNPTGYISNAIIPYKSIINTVLTVSGSPSALTIIPTWPSNTELTLCHTYNAQYTILARIGHFK